MPFSSHRFLELATALKRSLIAYADSAAQPDSLSGSRDDDKAFRGGVDFQSSPEQLLIKPLVDTDTDTPFPLALSILTPTPALTLVGLGVRKVSFLRVKVYSAGFYLEDSVLGKLDSVEGWHVSRTLFSCPSILGALPGCL